MVAAVFASWVLVIHQMRQDLHHLFVVVVVEMEELDFAVVQMVAASVVAEENPHFHQ
jgi:hypothetical protein